MINKILISRDKRIILHRDKRTLGMNGENLQEVLLFVLDEKVEGTGIVEVELPDRTKGMIEVNSTEEGYELPVKSSLLTQTGFVKFQLRILHDDVEIFKSEILPLEVKDSINATATIPEEYPSWIDTLTNLKQDLEKAEQERVSNENERISAEEERQENFTEMQKTVESAVSNIKDLTEEYNSNAEKETKKFSDNAAEQTKSFNENSDTKLAEYNKNHTDKEKEFNDNFDTKTKTFDDNAAAKLEAYNKNDTEKTNVYNANDKSKTDAYNDNTVLKEKAYNNNASNKTETFNSNAESKQNEYNQNAENKLTEYNQNAEELINKVEQVQAENEALKAENKLIKEQIPSASVSGNSVHIEDSSNLDFNWKIRARHYQKQTIQNDNLLILEDTTITKNGITLTIKDGVITIDGTSTAAINIDFKIKKKLKAGTYRHMVKRDSGSANGNISFLIMKSSGSVSTMNGSGGANFTLEEDTEVFYRIWTDKNNIISNVAYKCLISEGSDSKPWVQGIPDSPSVDYPSKIETVGSNVNLFDGELESGSLANNTGQNYANAKNTRSKNYIAVEENTTYVLSDNIKGSFIVHAYDENKNWLSMIGAQNYTGQYIFVTPPQTSYIRFRTNETDLTAKIKLERGSTITPYSPPGMGCVEINVINKNFINMQKKTTSWSGAKVTVENNKIIFVGASDGSLGLSFSSYESKIKMLKGNKITYSSRYISGSYTVGNTYYNLKLIYQDGTFTTINMNRSISTYKNDISNTITLEKDVVAYQINGAGIEISGLTNELVYEFQLEIGDSASEIVEQSSQTAIMPIQQEMLTGDYIKDVEHHEWGKLVLTGNENFVQAQNANKLNYFYLSSNLVKIKGKIISNMLKNIESGIIWNKTSYDDIVSSASNSKTINIMLSDTTITTLQQFKEKLKELYNAGTPIIIYYELAEPIDLELTSEQKALRNQKLYTYKNITNISIDNELASVEVEYKKDQDTINKNYENRLAALEAASIS